MSLLLNITKETDNCEPMEGLEGEREGKRGEEADEELEEWKRSGRKARVCYPSTSATPAWWSTRWPGRR